MRSCGFPRHVLPYVLNTFILNSFPLAWLLLLSCVAIKERNNESPWAYLRGLMRLRGGGWRFREFPELRARLDALRSDGSGPCGHLLSLLLELLEEQGSPEAVVEARALCDELTTVDPVRVPFW